MGEGIGIIVDKSSATETYLEEPPPYPPDSLVYKSNWDRYCESMGNGFGKRSSEALSILERIGRFLMKP